MKFCYLKHEQLCHHCQTYMFPGEEAVIIRLKTSNGYFPFVFHPQCFMKWNEDVFLYRYQIWKTQASPSKKKPKRGRPRKYKNYVQAYRTRCLLSYYKKTGNTNKILELDAQLKGLLVDN